MYSTRGMYSGLSRGARRTGELSRESKESEVRMATLKEQLERNKKRGALRQLLINQMVRVGSTISGNYDKYRMIQEGAKQAGATPANGHRGAFLSSLLGPDMEGKFNSFGRTLSAYDMLLLGNTSQANTRAGEELGNWMTGTPTKNTAPPTGDFMTPIKEEDIF